MELGFDSGYRFISIRYTNVQRYCLSNGISKFIPVHPGFNEKLNCEIEIINWCNMQIKHVFSDPKAGMEFLEKLKEKVVPTIHLYTAKNTVHEIHCIT